MNRYMILLLVVLTMGLVSCDVDCSSCGNSTYDTAKQDNKTWHIRVIAKDTNGTVIGKWIVPKHHMSIHNDAITFYMPCTGGCEGISRDIYLKAPTIMVEELCLTEREYQAMLEYYPGYIEQPAVPH